MSKIPHNFTSKILARDEESGFFIELQEIAPNSFFEKHKHQSDEWVYILKGTLADEFGDYPAGTFKINTQGSTHAPYSKNGCQLLVIRKANYTTTER